MCCAVMPDRNENATILSPIALSYDSADLRILAMAVDFEPTFGL